MITYKYSIYRPGGNDTALVETLILEPKLKRQINDAIMATNPKVEQVGFINFDKRQIEMAGGEFCGNATRSAVLRFQNGEPGILKIKVSGAKGRLDAGTDTNGNIWAEMPIYKDPSRLSIQKNYSVVEMQGITHVVTTLPTKNKSREELKKAAFNLLLKLDLITNVNAAGVMFVSCVNKRIKLDPIVWVRDIKTLFYETACASGTTAVGLVEALKRKQNINNLSIKQPSGKDIKVSVSFKKTKNKFINAFICGKVTIIKRNLTIKI